jgi:hypothetical protein
MRALTSLQAALARSNAQAVARIGDAPPSRMAEVAEEISRLFPREVAAAAAPSFGERELEALSTFRHRTQEPDFRTLRLACSACARYIAEDDYVLLADAGAFAALLAAVERYADEPRRLRRLFDVLRRAFLSADREADWFKGADARGCEGNERLRRFLEVKFAQVREVEPVLDWVHALTSYPEVLSSTPGQRFARELLAGDWQTLDAACRGLGLTGASWLVREAVRSAKDVAIAQEDDEAFKKNIPTLLALACEKRFAPLRDEVYAAVVTRYAAIPSPPVHKALRDALVGAWKNPWLERNRSAWTRDDVSDAARKMVGDWLKLEFLHQFFDVLSGERGQDQNRFEFWSQYHEQIRDVYIALGPNAYYSHDPDLVKLRHALEGRLLQLKSPGADTHAFVMFMDDVVVVEFSQKGNAAYLYLRKDAPVCEAVRSVTIGQLKNKSTGEWMPHVGAWQRRFAEELKLDHQVEPITSRRPPLGTTLPIQDIEHRARLYQTSAQGPNRNPGRPASPTNDEAPAWPVGFIPFVRRHDLKVDDLRFKGGSLWVITDDANLEITRQLVAWSFVYRLGRGWWWRTK